MHSVLPALPWGGANAIWTTVAKAACSRRARGQIREVKERTSTMTMMDASKSCSPWKICISTAHNIKQSKPLHLPWCVTLCVYLSHLFAYACALHCNCMPASIRNTLDQMHGEIQQVTWRHTILDDFVVLPVLVLSDYNISITFI